MTDRPTFKPGDSVKRTGESVPLVGVFEDAEYEVAGMVNGYVVLKDRPFAEFNPRGFRLVEEE